MIRVDVHPAEGQVGPEDLKVYKCRLPRLPLQPGTKVQWEAVGRCANLSTHRIGPDDHSGVALIGNHIHYFSTTSSGGILDVASK